MRVQKHFHLPSRTKQSFKDECDINNIMSKYMKNGLIEHVNQHKGRYEDLPESVEYHDALNQIREAETAFASLTASIRGRFKNDPGQFLAFVMDEENREEIISLGLGTQPEAPELPLVTDPAPESGESP